MALHSSIQREIKRLVLSETSPIGRFFAFETALLQFDEPVLTEYICRFESDSIDLEIERYRQLLLTIFNTLVWTYESDEDGPTTLQVCRKYNQTLITLTYLEEAKRHLLSKPSS